jgi:hypothetical protein
MTLLPTCSPRFATRRRRERESFGGELADIGRKLGQPFMPHQSLIAAAGCEVDPVSGLPAYREVIVTVPRQSGKTTLFLTWQVQRCVSPRWAHPQRSVFTAQSGKDARDKWLDELFPLLRRSKAMRPLIRRIYEGMGNEYVAFRNGSLIRLLSSSSSSGHSKTLHQAVLDEVWHDQDFRREQGLRPAMITMADAQLLVCSTAGTELSVVLDRKVAAGRLAAQEDTGHGIAYFEWSAPEGWDPDDEESYFSFMPALCPDPPCRCGRGRWRHTVTLDALRSERASMEPAEFARAYGNVPDRSRVASSVAVMPGWAQCADAASRVDGRVAVGFSVAPDRSWSSVAVAGLRADGLGHGEVIQRRPGTVWLGDYLEGLCGRVDPVVTVLNPAGAAAAFEKELIARGWSVKPAPGRRLLQLTGMREFAAACGELVKDVADQRFRHLGQEPLDDAVSAARTRPLGDGWAWSWKLSGADISSLEALTLAKHGFVSHGLVSAPDPAVF